MSQKQTHSTEVQPQSKPWKKVAVALLVAAAATALYVKYGEALLLDSLATKETELRRYGHQHPGFTYAVAFLIYVAVTGLSLPGAAGLTLIYGWYFGFMRGIILVSFASTTGATIAFLLSRFLFRDAIQKNFGDRLEGFNKALEREGSFYLFTLRLIPAVPFFVINAVMGLTPLKTTSYWWVSQLGMLPGTAVYVYAGSSVPSLADLAEQGTGGILTPRIILAFVLLGVFPLVVRSLMRKLSPITRTEANAAE